MKPPPFTPFTSHNKMDARFQSVQKSLANSLRRVKVQAANIEKCEAENERLRASMKKLQHENLILREFINSISKRR